MRFSRLGPGTTESVVILFQVLLLSINPGSASQRRYVTSSDGLGLASVRMALSQSEIVERAGRPTPAVDRSQEIPEDDEHFYWPPTLHCTECTGRELKRNYRIESIKTDILRKLRLTSPPNMTGVRLPNLPLINQMIEQVNLEDSRTQRLSEEIEQPPSGQPDEDHLVTLRVIQFSKPEEADFPRHLRNRPGIVYFKLPTADIRQVSQVVRANFGLYIRPISSTNSNTRTFTWILIYRLDPEGSATQSRELVRKRKIALAPSDTGMWYNFDLKNVVQRWIGQPESNIGLMIHASDTRGEPLAVTTAFSSNDDAHRPYLEVDTISLPVERQRRAFELNCDESSAEQRCCRYPLIVDFEAFQWNWIIVPKRYAAYYCSGECPFSYYQQDVHGHMVQQANPEGAGMPCCSPKKVSPISMLYYDESMNIVYGRLPGMVVDRCGCA